MFSNYLKLLSSQNFPKKKFCNEGSAVKYIIQNRFVSSLHSHSKSEANKYYEFQNLSLLKNIKSINSLEKSNSPSKKNKNEAGSFITICPGYYYERSRRSINAFTASKSCVPESKYNYKTKSFSLTNNSLIVSSVNITSGWFDMRNFCSSNEKSQVIDKNREIVNQEVKLTPKAKLKAGFKEYGSVFVIFHVGISLISLGCCYIAVASGLTESGFFKYWGIDEGATTVEVATYFVVAYAIHKAMAPARIAISLTAVPFLVKRLRKTGFFNFFKSKSA